LPSERTLNGGEPIGQDEIVFRRVLVSQYIKSKDYLSPKAFNPRKVDTTGISLCRANFLGDPKPESAAALGPEGMDFWVVELSAKSLAEAGMRVHPEPSESDPGHACIPILNADSANSSETKVLIEAASRLPRVVHGPFPGRAKRAAPIP
jgi:hypothetical protein